MTPGWCYYFRMVAAVMNPLPDPFEADPEQRIVVHDISWLQYDSLLETLGDAAGIRLAYLDGMLEIMSPSKLHERYGRGLGRLLSAYAEEHDLDLRAYGSATFRSEPKQKGAEPDECYVIGERPCAADGSEVDRPDLVIEVAMSHHGIDKLAVYAGLGVPEVWFWRHGRIEVHRLGSSGYQRVTTSGIFPDLDLALLSQLAQEANQTGAVKKLRAWARDRG